MIEFFFDCSSPWTYLAFSNIQPLAKQYNVPITWRPVLVGGIFNAVNPSVYNSRNEPVPAKQRYGEEGPAGLGALGRPEDQDAADGVPGECGRNRCAAASCWTSRASCCRSPPPASRPTGATIRISPRTRCWRRSAERVGVDPQKFLAGIAQQPIKEQLKANTDEVIARGGYGSPTMFVDRTDMYFGNDRLPLLREAVERKLGLRK